MTNFPPLYLCDLWQLVARFQVGRTKPLLLTLHHMVTSDIKSPDSHAAMASAHMHLYTYLCLYTCRPPDCKQHTLLLVAGWPCSTWKSMSQQRKCLRLGKCKLMMLHSGLGFASAMRSWKVWAGDFRRDIASTLKIHLKCASLHNDCNQFHHFCDCP